jgi:putative flippase GtrA
MISIMTNPRERSRFMKFAVVGLIGAVVDFGMMNLLRSFFSFPLVLAGTISFIAAILNNFFWNRFWTYPDSRSKPVSRQLIEFSIVSVTGLVIRIPVLKLVEPFVNRIISWSPLQFPYMSVEALSANITLSIAIIIVLFWNFFVNRYWTYNDVTS